MHSPKMEAASLETMVKSCKTMHIHHSLTHRDTKNFKYQMSTTSQKQVVLIASREK